MSSPVIYLLYVHVTIILISYKWGSYTQMGLPLDNVFKFFHLLQTLISPSEAIRNAGMVWVSCITTEELNIKGRTGPVPTPEAWGFPNGKNYYTGDTYLIRQSWFSVTNVCFITSNLVCTF